MGGADRVDDQRLGQVVDLGDDVLRRLEVDALDLLEPLDAAARRRAPRARSRRRDRPPDRRPGRRLPSRRSRHGVGQSTARPIGSEPNRVTIAVNSTVAPGWTAASGLTCVGAAEARRRLADAARRRGRPCEPSFVTSIVTARPPGAGVTRTTWPANGPVPAMTRAARDREHDDEHDDPDARRCRASGSPTAATARAGCRARTGRRPRARPRARSGCTGASARARRRGAGAGVWRRSADVMGRCSRSCHRSRDHQRSRGLDERVDVVGRAGEDDRAVGAGRPPALAGGGGLADPLGVGDLLVAQPLALEADEHELVRRGAGPRPRALEVRRQVRLEVVVERVPAVADPAARRAPLRVSPPMTIRGAGSGTGIRRRAVERVEVRRAADRAAGPQRADRGDRLLEVMRRAPAARGRGCRTPRARAARRRCPMPRMSRPPLAIWSVPAIRASTPGGGS